MRGHGAAKMRHTYTLVWRSTATFICVGGYATPDYLQVRIYVYTSTFHSPVHGTVTSRSGPGLNVCWLVKDLDRLRRGYKAQLLPST